MVVERDLADHIDLNFGCPVPKVTRRGGGAALPYKRRLFERDRAGGRRPTPGRIPVTVKMRIGIDDEHHTYLDAGRRAADAGVAAVALHARTAAQRYSGTADWSAIARLRDALPAELPVLGNGDIFSAGRRARDGRADRVRRRRRRAGLPGPAVAVRRPRGRVRRPAAARAADARAGRARPCAGTPSCSAQHMGADKGIRDMRKHIAWYLKGFPVGPELRRRLGMVGSLDELDELLGPARPDQPFPADADGPRGRQGSPRPRRAARALARRPRRPAVPSAPSWSTPAADTAPIRRLIARAGGLRGATGASASRPQRSRRRRATGGGGGDGGW